MWVICGGGIVGLSLAREAVLRGLGPVLVLEAEEDVGLHASGRNSGVLHAGIYYPPNSQKARFCLEGHRLLRAYIQERGLPLLATGKVVVARREEDLPELEEIHRRATASGAPISWVDERELQELFPGARTVERALFTPLTATTLPHRVMAALRQDLESMGVDFRFGVRCLGPAGPGKLRTTAGVFSFSRLINAAGMGADRLAHAFGVARHLRILPFQGIYYRLHPRLAPRIPRNLYPTPRRGLPFLGVHFTPWPDGRVWVGPTAIPALGRKHYGIVRGVDGEALRILLREAVLFVRDPAFRAHALLEVRKYLRPFFYADARSLFPELRPEDLLPERRVGLRAQLVDVEKGRLVMDYVVMEDGDTLHILNAVSPAFTSAFAFARYLVDRLTDASSS